MPLDNYTALQASVLGWLARPGDPLVAPAVPDMIRLFESEANRRLRVGGAEKQAIVMTVVGTSRIVLPADFLQLRQISIGGMPLQYMPPGPIPQNTGMPRTYSLSGPAEAVAATGYRIVRLDPQPDQIYQISILYQSGVPPLSDAVPQNWLLAAHPDAYLFGALAEAEAFIGHDERIPLWLQRREAVFGSIETADRKARWPGGLQILVDGITSPHGFGGGGGGGGGTPPPGSEVEVIVSDQAPSSPRVGDLWFDLVSAQTYCWVDDFSSTQWVPVINQAGAPSLPVAVIAPASGDTVSLGDVRPYYVDNATVLAALTLQLPSGPQVDDMVPIGFRNPVTALTMQDGAGAPVPTAPTSAYGPGAAIEFRYVSTADGWVYWK